MNKFTSALAAIKSAPFTTAAVVLGAASAVTGAVYLVKKYRATKSDVAVEPVAESTEQPAAAETSEAK